VVSDVLWALLRRVQSISISGRAASIVVQQKTASRGKYAHGKPADIENTKLSKRLNLIQTQGVEWIGKRCFSI
jgi:hypothetical protein